MAFLSDEEMKAARKKQSVELELSIGKKVRLLFGPWAATEEAARAAKAGGKDLTAGRDLILTIAKKGLFDDDMQPLFKGDKNDKEVIAFLECLDKNDLKKMLDEVRNASDTEEAEGNS